jgi:flagellar hook-associated protein 3 FlgL
MSLRIADLDQSRRLTTSVVATQARMREAQTAIATGKAAGRYDRIAGEAGLLLRAQDARALKAGYLEQSQHLAQKLQAADVALGGLIGIAERARALLVQRLDGGTGTDMQLGAEIDGMLAEAASRLNTRLGQDYLFAGSRTGTRPVELPAVPATAADPALYYRGDEVRPSARADQGVEITYGVTASDPAFSGLIAALGQAHAAHAAGDRAGLEGALQGLGEALAAMVDVRAGLGAAAERLESIASAHEAGIALLDGIVSGITDTDVPEVMTGLARDQASLEAAYAVTGRLAALSLTDYLR